MLSVNIQNEFVSSKEFHKDIDYFNKNIESSLHISQFSYQEFGKALT